ncbi:MAG: hypothetical protein IPK26_18340 [Planctomycetes bacterium]|nr:hypothetical protein [Planctomycetota bacterium]
MQPPPRYRHRQGPDSESAVLLLALLGERRHAKRAALLKRLLQALSPARRPEAPGGSKPVGRWSSAVEILRARQERDLAQSEVGHKEPADRGDATAP